MALYYIQKDENQFVTTMKKELLATDVATDWQQIIVATQDESLFGLYFDKFRVTDTGEVLKPGNLPALSVSALKEMLDQAKTDTKAVEMKIEQNAQAQNETNTTLQNGLADSENSISQVNESLLEISDLILGSDESTDTSTDEPTDTTAKEGDK